MKIIETNIKQNKMDISDNQYLLNCIYDNISKADNKISIMFAVFSIFFGLINPFNIIKTAGFSCCCVQCIFYLIFTCTILLFVLCGVFFFLALCPNFAGISKNKEYSIFYGNINNFDNVNEFLSVSSKITKDEYNINLQKQIYFNSTICMKKMTLFKKGLICSSLGMLFLIILQVLTFFPNI